MSNYLKAYKYRIYPNLEQREYLVKTFGCTRFIYNQMLADRIKSYQENKDLDIKVIDMVEVLDSSFHPMKR